MMGFFRFPVLMVLDWLLLYSWRVFPRWLLGFGPMTAICSWRRLRSSESSFQLVFICTFLGYSTLVRLCLGFCIINYAKRLSLRYRQNFGLQREAPLLRKLFNLGLFLDLLSSLSGRTSLNSRFVIEIFGAFSCRCACLFLFVFNYLLAFLYSLRLLGPLQT